MKTNWMFSQTAHIPPRPFYCDSDRDTANVRSSTFSTLLPINSDQCGQTGIMIQLIRAGNEHFRLTSEYDNRIPILQGEVGCVVLSADRGEPRTTHNQLQRDDKQTQSQRQHFNSSCKTTALFDPH